MPKKALRRKRSNRLRHGSEFALNLTLGVGPLADVHLVFNT
jgi:hypothetical protein